MKPVEEKRKRRFTGVLVNSAVSETIPDEWFSEPDQNIGKVQSMAIPQDSLARAAVLHFYILWAEKKNGKYSKEEVEICGKIYQKLWDYFIDRREHLNNDDHRLHIWTAICKFGLIHHSFGAQKGSSSASASLKAGNLSLAHQTLLPKERPLFLKSVLSVPILDYPMTVFLAALTNIKLYIHKHPFSDDLEKYINALFHKCCHFSFFADDNRKQLNHPNYAKVTDSQTDNKKFYSVNRYFHENMQRTFFELILKFRIHHSFKFKQGFLFNCGDTAARNLNNHANSAVSGNSRRLITEPFQKDIYELNLLLGEREDYLARNRKNAVDPSPYNIIMGSERPGFIDKMVRLLKPRELKEHELEPFANILHRRKRLFKPISIKYNHLFYLCINFFFKGFKDDFDISKYFFFPKKMSDLHDIQQADTPIVVCDFNTYYVMNCEKEMLACTDIESAIVLWCLECHKTKLTDDSETTDETPSTKTKRLNPTDTATLSSTMTKALYTIDFYKVLMILDPDLIRKYDIINKEEGSQENDVFDLDSSIMSNGISF